VPRRYLSAPDLGNQHYAVRRLSSALMFSLQAGQLTPALAMGDALLARLQRSGIRFRLRGDTPTS